MQRVDFNDIDRAPERFREEMEQEAYERQRDEMEEQPRMTQMEAYEAAEESVSQLKKDFNVFKTLNAINVNEHAEKKGKFTYLSWSWAVSELLKNFPEATWEVKRFNDLPYLQTDTGYYVEVEVSINGVSRTQIHPVLDNFNKPLAKPNAFQINTSIQRCLAKAISLHGLGLYIYSGEDLPEVTREENHLKAKYFHLLKKHHQDNIPKGIIENAKTLSLNDLKLAINHLENKG